MKVYELSIFVHFHGGGFTVGRVPVGYFAGTGHTFVYTSYAVFV